MWAGIESLEVLSLRGTELERGLGSMGNASITMKLPQGFRDEFGLEAEQKQALSESIVHCLQQRGYKRINTPLVEYEEVFDDYEMKNQQSMYRFLNSDNRDRKSVV